MTDVQEIAIAIALIVGGIAAVGIAVGLFMGAMEEENNFRRWIEKERRRKQNQNNNEEKNG